MLIAAHERMMIKREIGADLLVFRLAIGLGVGACPGFYPPQDAVYGSHLHLLGARRAGYDEWAERLARRVSNGAAKVWVALDPDALNLGSVPDFGTEPLGPTLDEVVELLYLLRRSVGRDGFGDISIMAAPQMPRRSARR